MNKTVCLCGLLASCASSALFASPSPPSPAQSDKSADRLLLASQDSGAPTASTPVAVDPAAGGETGGLEDIVVTATRREERLQNVPVTVTAVTSSSLRAAGITDVRGLTQVVPGFFGGRNFGLFLPVIRGVGSNSVSAADEANVATYIDGVYQPDPFSTFVELAEVERVEVLRGPQGTVFGRNATGGLINVITPEPQFAPRGRVSARVGRLRNNAGDYDLRAYATGGLSEKFAADVSGVYRKTEDYVTDLVRGGEIGGSRVVNLRSKLLFKPSDESSVILTAEYTDQDSSLVTLQPVGNNTAGRRFPGVIIPGRAWQASSDIIPTLDFTRYNLALRTKFDLGSVSLETATGYMNNKTIQISDSDSSNIFLGVVAAASPHIRSVSYSQEIKLLSANDGPLKWILGAYGFRLDAAAGVVARTRAGGPGTARVDTLFKPELQTTSFAGFGEGTYRIGDSLFLTAGLRYTTEKREFSQTINGVNLFTGASKSFEKLTYRAAFRYEFSPAANLYGSYGTGFKSGVYNFIGTSRNPVKPENIKAYELGIKADPLPWLRTNLSTYYYDYSELQLQARDTIGTGYILQNAGSAEIYGGELEITAVATRNLSIRASAAYTHAQYKEFPLAQTFVPLPVGGNMAVTADVSGNEMTRAPRTTFNIGFNWGHDVAGGRLNVAGNVFHSARVYFDFANLASQKPYTLSNGEIAWTDASERWTLSLWATNLTDERVYRELRTGAFGNDGAFEMPRRVGVGAALKF